MLIKSLARPGRKQANVSVRMTSISFGALPCRGKKNLMTARVSMLLKSRASLTCFRACFRPGRANDLSAPRQVRKKYSTKISTLDNNRAQLSLHYRTIYRVISGFQSHTVTISSKETCKHQHLTPYCIPVWMTPVCDNWRTRTKPVSCTPLHHISSNSVQ